jgi:hypothetical protein
VYRARVRWFRRSVRSTTTDPLVQASPFGDAQTEELEVIEIDADGRLHGLPRWPQDDSLREPAYASAVPDGTGTRGIWTAIEHA